MFKIRISFADTFETLGVAFAVLLVIAMPLHAETRLEEEASRPKDETGQVHKIDVKIGKDNLGRDEEAASLDSFGSYSPHDGADAFARIRAIQERIERMLDDSMVRGLRGPSPRDLAPRRTFEPPVNVEDHGDHLVVTMDLPGLKKEEIEVSVKDGLLTVSGTRKGAQEVRKEEKGRKFYRQERFSGTFKRSIRLPVPVEESTIKAKYHQGVLSIEAAKIPMEEEQRIRVE